MLQGQIEQFSSDGTVSGWFRKSTFAKPAIARIAFNDGTVQRVIADRFRRDLLERGISHGHYGFLLRAPAVAASGATLAVLLDDETESPVAEARMSGLPLVQSRAYPLLLHVEDIIAPEQRWTCEDIATHVSNFNVTQACSSLGVETFVERIAQFCFGEFPSSEMMMGFADAIKSRTATPERVFLAMLDSKQALEKGVQSLPGPYSPEYPFS
ncbi:hypothetical protein [Methylobacterium durans]|uniref:Uncharacterized protein n=1 Tax=Methylobacterium durans TaxID=2202825 RepID=A0A2U8W6N8_9HYPH|nr:hypothetical protein [Methylobacterium durans]AWN41745.1 hypothetical protein DK389_16055 [Methylobacterium durans]